MVGARTEGPKSGRTWARTPGMQCQAHDLGKYSRHAPLPCAQGTHSWHAIRARIRGMHPGHALRQRPGATKQPANARPVLEVDEEKDESPSQEVVLIKSVGSVADTSRMVLSPLPPQGKKAKKGQAGSKGEESHIRAIAGEGKSSRPEWCSLGVGDIVLDSHAGQRPRRRILDEGQLPLAEC